MIVGIIMGAVLLIVAVGIALWVISVYNTLIRVRNKTDLNWAQVDVVLKKRFDLVPGLVETCKGYAAHEKDTFDRIARARGLMNSAGTVAEQANANNVLTSALKTLFAVAEAYPELKANENFMHLQTELTAIEDKIVYQRQFYNDSVYAYNTMIQQFPVVLVAKAFRFTEKELFNTTDEEEREPVKFTF